MKKLLIVPAVIVAMLFGQMANATVEYTLAFSDVDQDTSYMTAIAWMQGNGVIQGYPDGTFQPDQCVNRAEFLKMLYLTRGPEFVVSDGLYGITFHESRFSDTYTDQWYWPYVNAALEEGLVEGYPDGTFKPGQCVNRVEAIKMGLLGFYDGELPDYAEGLWSFADVDRTQWYGEYIVPALFKDLVGRDHITAHTPDSIEAVNFYPGESMSRKEVAEMLFRMKTVVDNDLDVFDPYKAPRTVNNYVSPNGRVSFMMPTGWVVTSDVLYETTGGVVATYPTIQFQGPYEDQSVAINQRMMDCGDQAYAAKCYELSENYTIGAFESDLGMLQMMELVKLTFQEPKAPELAFDGCGIVGDYNSEDWFTDFIVNWDALLPTLDGFASEHDPIFSQQSEGCLSLDGSQLVFVPNVLIDGCAKVFRYDIGNDEIIQASSDSDYCVSEFGARTGDYITMLTVNDYYGCPMQSGQYYYNEDRFVSDLGDCSPTDGWVTFTNSEYNYEVKHPANLEFTEMGMGLQSAEVAPFVMINGVGFSIEVIVNSEWEGVSPELDFLLLDLDEYAQTVWDSNYFDDNPNFPNKQVSILQSITMNGFDAYQFSVNDSYQDGKSGYILDEEYTYTIFKVGDDKVAVWFPTSYEDGYWIMESLTFLQ